MLWKKRRIYLDVAAGAEGNPSSPHEEGRKAKKMLEDARTSIARLLEVQSDDVIFTSGATEANALAILGTVHRKQKIENRKKVHALYLPSAHASIVENMNVLAEEGVSVEALPIKNYRVDCESLKDLLRPETVLVSMDVVCGETGVVWNTREVAEVLRKQNGNAPFSFAQGTAATHKKVRIPVLLHVDASQAVFTEKLTRAHFAADLLTLDGSKVGVRGIGALVAHRTIPLAPLYRGGGQERGVRAGSESPELAERFAAALGAAALSREKFCASAELERARLIASILKHISNVFFNEGRSQAPNILNISLLGRDTDYLVALLDEAGFAVSSRSACETDSEEGSRAVYALTSDHKRAKSTLRISWNARTSLRDLIYFAEVLIREVAFIDNRSHG